MPRSKDGSVPCAAEHLRWRTLVLVTNREDVAQTADHAVRLQEAG